MAAKRKASKRSKNPYMRRKSAREQDAFHNRITQAVEDRKRKSDEKTAARSRVSPSQKGRDAKALAKLRGIKRKAHQRILGPSTSKKR